MAIKIRLTRGGSKKRPFYRVVAADSRMPRDGRFIEKLGTYNPLLPKEDPNRVNLNIDKINEWIKKGAQVSDRIARILENLSILEPKKRNNPKKGTKHKATLDREASKSEKKLNAEKEKSSEDINNKVEGAVNQKNDESQSVLEKEQNNTVKNETDDNNNEDENKTEIVEKLELTENKIAEEKKVPDKSDNIDQKDVEKQQEVDKKVSINEKVDDTSKGEESEEKK